MSKLRVAINGFGRIGRLVLRAYQERGNDLCTIVAINDLTPQACLEHLFEYDSIHGRYDGKIAVESFTAIQQTKDLPWQQLGVDLVLECSGYMNSKAQVMQHIDAGAKRVLVSAPLDDADATIVFGVNQHMLNQTQQVISNASCTTNCLAPVVYLLDKEFKILQGYMTTIHAYTADQSIVDRAHKDLRRARAANLSIIPTTTGAAKSIGKVIPALHGKLDGVSIRVPVANVSFAELVFTTAEPITVTTLHDSMRAAANGAMRGILAINQLPLVSVDFNHRSESAIFDEQQTHLLSDNMCKVAMWYDNEWAFAHRMVDVSEYIATLSG